MDIVETRRELGELTIILNELHNRRNELLMHINNLERIEILERNRIRTENRLRIEERQKFIIKQKIMALKKSEVNNNMTNCCGICLNTHKKIDSIICSCSHEYGKECFQQWAINCKNNNKKINCPTCRSDTIGILSFRERNKKTKTNVIIQPAVIVQSNVQIQAVPNPILNLV